MNNVIHPIFRDMPKINLALENERRENYGKRTEEKQQKPFSWADLDGFLIPMGSFSVYMMKRK